MTEQTDEKPQLRPWQWPGEWVKDEKFWREVTARALSGLIVIGLGALGAVAAGIIPHVDFFRLGLTLATVFAYIGVSIERLARNQVKRQAENKEPKLLTPLRTAGYICLSLLWLAGLVLIIWSGSQMEL